MNASLKNITDICDEYLMTSLVSPLFPHLNHVSIYSRYVIIFSLCCCCYCCMRLFVLHLGQPRHFFLYVCLYVYPADYYLLQCGIKNQENYIQPCLTLCWKPWSRFGARLSKCTLDTFSRSIGFGWNLPGYMARSFVYHY